MTAFDTERRALGDGRPIEGIRVAAEQGWSAAHPAGTEAVSGLSAERFTGRDRFRRIQEETLAVSQKAFGASGAP